MTKVPKSMTAYVVVEVWRGFAVSARSFSSVQTARQCLSRLRRQHNLDEDDVQIFRKRLRLPK
jgi:hypothetical protein